MMEITNNIIKWVYSLSQKKNRTKEKCFIVEGTKCVLDTIKYFNVKYLFASEQWCNEHKNLDTIVATKVQLERMSMLKTPTEVIAVYDMPCLEVEDLEMEGKLNLVLDNIQDPGNLGTIIRIADWFGIHNIICAEGTVDVYNPKVIQATMGAIARVKVVYCDLPELFNAHKKMPVFGTFLDGDNLYDAKLEDYGFIVMGNEGNGISKELEPFMSQRLLIPSFPEGETTSESLNVGMATALIVGEFRRRMRK